MQFIPIPDDVQARIRERYRAGGVSHRELAREFGLTSWLVFRILHDVKPKPHKPGRLTAAMLETAYQRYDIGRERLGDIAREMGVSPSHLSNKLGVWRARRAWERVDDSAESGV